MVGLDVAHTLGPWVVLNVCRTRANPEMGMRGGVSAATVAVRLVIWGSWRGYDYEPWSNGHPFLAPLRAPETSAKGHRCSSVVNGPSPNVMSCCRSHAAQILSARGGAARGLPWGCHRA